MFVHTMQPVVQSVGQPVGQPVASCKQTPNRLFNWLDNRLYRLRCSFGYRVGTTALDEGAHWRHVASTSEPSVRRRCGLVSNHLDRLCCCCTAERSVYYSCQEIRDASSSAASGEYTIRTITGRILDKVNKSPSYPTCEIGLYNMQI